MTKKIIKELKKHRYLEFYKYKDLKALCVNAESFGIEEEIFDFEELIFAVPADWLISYVKEFGIDDLDYWLQNKYTSDESYKVYCAALAENKIVMLNFN